MTCQVGQVNNVESGTYIIYVRYHNHLDSSILRTEWTK
jgi:hypothetical protein